jgi:hypothetical protein
MKPNNEHKLFENMLRFKTKNLALNEGLSDYLMRFISDFKQMFAKSNIRIKFFKDILEMLKQDTDPESIIRYMQEQDETITREAAIKVIKEIGRIFEIYVDFKNDNDITPTT